jgi:hypothetical protein
MLINILKLECGNWNLHLIFVIIITKPTNLKIVCFTFGPNQFNPNLYEKTFTIMDAFDDN